MTSIDDGPVRLPGNASPTPLPAEWRVLSETPLTIEGPERDVRLMFLMTKRSGATEIASTALARAQHGRTARVLNSMEVPKSSGWDAVQQVVFDTSATPGLLLMSFHYLLGETAFVAILDGTRAAVDRRMAQIAEILEAWKPPGRSQETLAGSNAVWDGERGAALDAFVQSAMQRNRVPGAAVALVLTGRTVHAGGYGVTQLDGDEPVTPQTRFRMGSITKPLTTLMMARLIERGLFGWETPVRELSPEFSLADPKLTQMRMRHTVNASTGMPRRDLALVFRFGGVTAEQRMAELRAMAPTTDLGEVFQYSNHLVALGGYVAAQRAFPSLDLSSAYASAMQELVFDPLGMRASFITGNVEARDVARPHSRTLGGGVSPIADQLERFVDSVAPAGAALSTVNDMAKYLALELSGGKLSDGQRLVRAEALAIRRSGGAKITQTEAYGLGLACNTQLGSTLLHHAGGTLGFSSNLFFLPEPGIGAIVVANLGGASGFCEVVCRRILELAFGLDEKAEAVLAAAAEARENLTRGRLQRIQRDQLAMEWLDQFAGTYHDHALGTLSIGRRGASVWARFADYESELGMDVREETRLLALVSPPWPGLTLLPSSDRAGLVLASGQEEYVFQRRTQVQEP